MFVIPAGNMTGIQIPSHASSKGDYGRTVYFNETIVSAVVLLLGAESWWGFQTQMPPTKQHKDLMRERGMKQGLSHWFPDFPSVWESYCEIDEATGQFLLSRLNENERTIYPHRKDWFAAFHACQPSDVKVVILGQDPYINEEGGIPQAMGLSFSVPQGHKCPPSLRNIFKEMIADIGTCPSGTDLSDLSRQGVLLLNVVLTVNAGESDSHKDYGWQTVTNTAIVELSRRHSHLAFVLWGDKAGQVEQLICSDNGHLVIRSAHPSPLSARRGFWGSRPFSRVNDFLVANSKAAIRWGD